MSIKHFVGIASLCALIAGAASSAAAQPGPVPTEPPPGWQWHPQAGWVWVGVPGQPAGAPQPPAPQPSAPQPPAAAQAAAAQPPAAPAQPPASQPPAAPPQQGYAPQPSPQGYAPQPSPQGYAPPQQGYAPQPAQPGYAQQPPPPQWAAAPAAGSPAPQPAAEPPAAEEPTDWSTRVRAAAMRPTLTVQGYSGAGAESEVEVGPTTYTSDKELAPGGALTFVVPVVPYLALGALTGLRSWTDGYTSSLGCGNHLMWDIDALVQARLPFSATGSQVYLNVPFGVSLNFMDEGPLRWDEDFTTNVGFNVGFTAGVKVMFGRVFGLMAEMGYAHHAPSVRYQYQDVEIDLDWSFNEFSFNTGLVFAF